LKISPSPKYTEIQNCWIKREQSTLLGCINKIAHQITRTMGVERGIAERREKEENEKVEGNRAYHPLRPKIRH
jgi:hypothetical protein